MIRHLKAGALATGLLVAAGCTEPVSGVGGPQQVMELDGLRLELSTDHTVIAIGDSATLTMRLVNDNDSTVVIGFNSGCQILPYIQNSAGALRYPNGGGWGCTAALTSLEVPARGSVTRSLVVRGAAVLDDRNGASLIPGTYRAYALLDANMRQQQLRSPTVSFEIR